MANAELYRFFKAYVLPKYSIDIDGDAVPLGRATTPLSDVLLKHYTKTPAIMADMTLNQFTTEIVDMLKDRVEEPREDAGMLDIGRALGQFLRDNEVTITDTGQIIRKPHTELSAEMLREPIKDWCYTKNEKLSKDDTNYVPEQLQARLVASLQTQQVELWAEIMEDIAYRKELKGTLPGKLKSLLTALRVSDNDEQKHAADLRMLAHFMWTVKRRILKMDFNPSLPLMLIFESKQKAGKTTFIEKLWGAPLKGKVISTDLSVIHDGAREFRKWVDNAIVNFDELAMRGLSDNKRNRTPEILKALLTASTTQERTFHTQNQQTYHIRASFCATSNKPIAEYLADPTGMRRFWSIKCETDEQPFDFEALNSFDFLDLWQSVNENAAQGYVKPGLDIMPYIDQVQDTYCIQPSLRRWFEELFEPFTSPEVETVGAIAPTFETDDYRERGIVLVPRSALYETYVMDQQERGGYPVSENNFLLMLAKMGVKEVGHSLKRIKKRLYILHKLDQGAGGV